MKFNNFFYPDGILPFPIPEQDEEGNPFTKWDGTTIYKYTNPPTTVNPNFLCRIGYYDGYYAPSKSSSKYVTVYGPKSLYCVKLELDQVMELFWRAITFTASISTWSPTATGTTSGWGVTSTKSLTPIQSSDVFSPSWKWGKIPSNQILSNPTDLVANTSFNIGGGEYTQGGLITAASFVYPVTGVNGNPVSDVFPANTFGQSTGTLTDVSPINRPDLYLIPLYRSNWSTSINWALNVLFSGASRYHAATITTVRGFDMSNWGFTTSSVPHVIRVFNNTSKLWEYWMNPSVLVHGYVNVSTGGVNSTFLNGSTSMVGATSEKTGFFQAPYYAFSSPGYAFSSPGFKSGWTISSPTTMTVTFNFKDGSSASGIMSAGIETTSQDSPDSTGNVSASTTLSNLSLSSVTINVSDVIDFSP